MQIVTPTGVAFAAQRREAAAVALPRLCAAAIVREAPLAVVGSQRLRKSTRLQAAPAVAAQLLIYYIVTFIYCVTDRC